MDLFGRSPSVLCFFSFLFCFFPLDLNIPRSSASCLFFLGPILQPLHVPPPLAGRGSEAAAGAPPGAWARGPKVVPRAQSGGAGGRHGSKASVSGSTSFYFVWRPLVEQKRRAPTWFAPGTNWRKHGRLY